MALLYLPHPFVRFALIVCLYLYQIEDLNLNDIIDALLH